MSADIKGRIISDIARVAKQLHKTKLSRAEYMTHGKYSEYQLYDGGQTWGQLCALAGLGSLKVVEVADDEYFDRLHNAVKQLGRLPKVTERKHFGLNMSKRRYPTLRAFYERAAERGVIEKSLLGSVEPKTLGAGPRIQFAPAQGARSVPPIPAHTRRRKWERTGVDGLPYAPQDELGVVALFAVLCAKHILNWSIIDLSAKGVDARCHDHDAGNEIRVELKYLLSRSSWNHSFEDVDYVVCWENRWPDFPKPVLALRDVLRDYESRKA